MAARAPSSPRSRCRRRRDDHGDGRRRRHVAATMDGEMSPRRAAGATCTDPDRATKVRSGQNTGLPHRRRITLRSPAMLIKGVFMGIRLHRTKVVAAATAVVSAAALALVAAAPADAATAVKTVRVRMSDSSIIFTGGGATTSGGVTTLHAGRYHFHVVGRGGDHSLQLLRFQNGYTPEQAQTGLQRRLRGERRPPSSGSTTAWSSWAARTPPRSTPATWSSS